MTLLAEKIVEEFDKKNSIANVDHSGANYEQYLNMSAGDLDAIDKQGCLIAQHTLLRYAISVNKKLNILRAQYSINEGIFTRSLVKVHPSYDKFLGNKLIIASACNEFDYINEMQIELSKMNAIIISMEGLVERVDKMIQLFKDLSFIKGKY